MALRVLPGYREQLIAATITELAARKEREELGAQAYESDICDWTETHFYIPRTSSPVKLPLHQKAILRYFFTRDPLTHHFRFQTYLYSTVKKSGKSTTAGIISRHFAETQTRYGEIYTIGNDLEQAKERSYKEIVRSLELTPGYNLNKSVLPGRWVVNKLSMRCLLTGSSIKAIAVDAKGEAGGQQAMTVWTELWGAENIEAKRFWDEMTPIPTVPDSIRVVETYAGYDGESMLLYGLYQRGLEGHQMTAGELAAIVCNEDKPGETFDDFVNCWHETKGDPNVLIPIYTNPQAGIGMYWDDGMKARRMPWQHMFELWPDHPGFCANCRRSASEHDIGITADQYYQNEEAGHLPQAFRRLHLNEWVGAESQFVPMESWDACGGVHELNNWKPIQIPKDGERTKLVASADAAVTGDCFGTVVVQRCPYATDCVDIRALKKWDPKEERGGIIQLDEPEAFLRAMFKVNNVVQLAYDPYQMENMAQRFTKEGIVWADPFTQTGDRLKADSQLYDLVVGRRLHYSHQPGCPGGGNCNCMMAAMREHIGNCNAKVQTDEDSKIRIVKKAAGRKIDLAVALSMASARCLYLNVQERIPE